jgi:DNA-directed RNA polymerase II subunit RPB1
VKLARAVFHVGFVDTALKVLRSVCHHCSRLRVDRTDIKFKEAMKERHPKKRLDKLHEICRGKQT